MHISILIPCYNEERSIRKAAASWLAQTRPADEIIVIDDCSTDTTTSILKEFKGKIKVVRTPRNTGNKSSAQEYGLQFVKGDIFVATDADTLLNKHFLEHIENDFQDPEVAAVGGYVKSLKYNWLTACRGLDYAIGQNIDKLAQDYVNYMFVIPGSAGAFRTEVFKKLGFDHDTLTEDLDFTYKLHERGYKIKYDRMAICYTQDPTTLRSYINQMRRWYAGGWQNFRKHLAIPNHPGKALELPLIYGEGLAFSLILYLIPLINIRFALFLTLVVIPITLVLALFGAFIERRWDFIVALPGYLFLKYVNSWIYLEQFVKIILFKRKSLVWFKPERVQI